MEPNRPHRTLVVANRTAAAPLLLEEIARRRAERPTVLVVEFDQPSGGGFSPTRRRAAAERARSRPAFRPTRRLRGVPSGRKVALET